MNSTVPLEELGSLRGKSYAAIEQTLDALGPDRLESPETQWLVEWTDEAPSAVLAVAPDGQSGVRASLDADPRAAAPVGAQDLAALRQSVVEGDVERLRSRELRWIQAAMPAFLKQRLDLTKYRLVLIRQGSMVTVIFEDIALPEGTLGVRVATPGFEVAMHADTREVLRANFTR